MPAGNASTLFTRGATYRVTRTFTGERDEFVEGETLVYWRHAVSIYDGLQGFFFLVPDGSIVRSWDLALRATLEDPPFVQVAGVADVILAAEAGDAARVSALLDPDAEGDGAARRLALESAVVRGRAKVVAEMVGRPAFATLRQRALFDAAAAGQPLVLEVLLAAGVDADSVDDSGQTALRSAVFGGHESSVARLLAAGADPDRDAWKRAGMIDFARRQGSLGIAALLGRG